MYFDEGDLIEMARRDRADEERAQASKARREAMLHHPSNRGCPCACSSGGFCGGCGHAGCGGRR
jgi:hypothetical protein